MRDAHVQNIFNQVFNICRREFFTNYNFIYFKRSIGEVSIDKILVACKLKVLSLTRRIGADGRLLS